MVTSCVIQGVAISNALENTGEEKIRTDNKGDRYTWGLLRQL